MIENSSLSAAGISQRDSKYMSTLTDHDKDALLKLARSTLSSKLIKGSKIQRPAHISEAMKEKRGCFVTLHKRGLLRGCIGTIEPLKPLVILVEENAVNAAFRDPRFPPVEKDELPVIDIEISVLTIPRVLKCGDCEDLKNQLEPGTHGVIISRGNCRATFLPQVWEQLPDRETFLECLCRKACMDKDAWKSTDTVVEVYEAEYFSEKKDENNKA
jgi:AmmeMemoRadiSam system protein A